jgi:hypothetical protein
MHPKQSFHRQDAAKDIASLSAPEESAPWF